MFVLFVLDTKKLHSLLLSATENSVKEGVTIPSEIIECNSSTTKYPGTQGNKLRFELTDKIKSNLTQHINKECWVFIQIHWELRIKEYVKTKIKMMLLMYSLPTSESKQNLKTIKFLMFMVLPFKVSLALVRNNTCCSDRRIQKYFV